MNKFNFQFCNVPWSENSEDKPGAFYLNNYFKNTPTLIDKTGWFNIIDEINAEVTIKFTRQDKITEYNYCILKAPNDFYNEKRYYFIESYELQTDNIYCKLKLDIWSTYFFKLILKDRIKLQRGHINRFIKKSPNKYYIDLDNFGLFLKQDELNNLNYFGSENMALSINCNWKTPIPQEGNETTFNLNGGGYYAHSIFTISKDKAANYPNTKNTLVQPPSLFLTENITVGKTIGFDFITAPGLVKQFYLPFYLGDSIDTFGPAVNFYSSGSRDYFGIPLDGTNGYWASGSQYNSLFYNEIKYTYIDPNDFTNCTRDVNISKDFIYNFNPKINDPFNYKYEPKLNFSPYTKIKLQLGNDTKEMPYEWFANPDLLFYCNINISFEHIEYLFTFDKQPNTENFFNLLQIARISLLDEATIPFLNNAYENYMNNHFNTYNQRWINYGLNMSQGGIVKKALNTITSPTSIFGDVEQAMNIKAEISDLAKQPSHIEGTTQTETSTINWKNDAYDIAIANKPYSEVEKSQGKTYLHNIKATKIKPSITQQEEIAFHYHLYGYQIDNFYFKQDDVNNRSVFNYWKLNTLIDAFEITNLPTWAQKYFENEYKKGVRVWEWDDSIMVTFLVFSYNTMNWENNLLS